MRASVLSRGGCLWASLPATLADREVVEIQEALLKMVAEHDARAVVVDVSALDIIDSFVARALTTVARSNALRGAITIVVGIRPEVADAMSHCGIELEFTTSALDIDAALEHVGRVVAPRLMPQSPDVSRDSDPHRWR